MPDQTETAELRQALAELVNAAIATRPSLDALADVQRLLESTEALKETAAVLDNLDGAIAGAQELLP